MSKSIFILFFGIALSLTLAGQESISGVVYDGHTLRPLSKATVRMGHRNVRTDATGAFTVSFKKDKELEISATGFHDCDRSPNDITDFNNVAIYLVPLPQVKGLKVSADAVGVYEPDFEYLFDFEFIDNLLIVGSYLNRNLSDRSPGSALKNCALSLFERGELTHRMIIPDFPQRLRRSAFGEVYIEGIDYALLVQEERGKLSYKEFDFKEFRANIVPWTVVFSNSAFKVRIVKEIPQVEHYCYQTNGESKEVIRTARNRAYFAKTFLDHTMLDKDQRALAQALSEEQGFDKELYASYIRAVNGDPNFNSYRANYGGVDRDLRPPYTPVYKKNESIVILDAMNQWIYVHDQLGEALDSVYFQVKLSGEQLLNIEQDRITEKLYTIHEKKGVHLIRELDPNKGALGRPMKLVYPFPEKLKIYNGSVFYIRHDANDQFKHLYKETLDFR